MPSSYDIDILSPDFVTFSKDVAALLADFRNHNERMFLLTFLVLNTTTARQQLENDGLDRSTFAQLSLRTAPPNPFSGTWVLIPFIFKAKDTPLGVFCFGGEGGIRTHVPFPTN